MKIRDRIKELRRIPAGELLPNPKNWRTHPDQQKDALRGVLAEVGFADAVLVRETDEGYMLIDGHLRGEVASDSEIPALVLDVNEAEADKILATHDPLAAMAEADAVKLDAILREVDTGSEALQEMLSELAEGEGLYQDGDGEIEDDEAPVDKAEELREKWGVELGQLWLIHGKQEHRLLCGDSTKEADVARAVGGEKVELVVTDPPYGVSYASKNRFLNSIGRGNTIQEPILGDQGEKSGIQEMWKSAFRNMNTAMAPGAVVYCFMPQGGDQMMMMMMMMGAGIEPRHELIWVKNNHVLGRVDYAYKHEPILYAWKDGGHKFYGDFQTSILEFPKPQKSDSHPTMKPVELVAKLVENSSQVSGNVFDPFLGSGTTMVAAEQLNRRCHGIELEPKYVAVALERMAGLGCECEVEK